MKQTELTRVEIERLQSELKQARADYDASYREWSARDNHQAAEIERLRQWQLKATQALTACYQAGHREGWQDGPTTNEAMEMVLALVPFPGDEPSGSGSRCSRPRN